MFRSPRCGGSPDYFFDLVLGGAFVEFFVLGLDSPFKLTMPLCAARGSLTGGRESRQATGSLNAVTLECQIFTGGNSQWLSLMCNPQPAYLPPAITGFTLISLK
jgi:hypothetical protein